MKIGEGETRKAKMPKSILVWTTQTSTNRATPRLEFVRLFRLNRWLTYLIVVPLIAAVTLLAIFFFAAFLGLFAAVLAVAALRVWWLRRKLRRDDRVRRFKTEDHLVRSHGPEK